MTATVIQPALTTGDLQRALTEALAGYDADARRDFRCHLLGTLVWQMHAAGLAAGFLEAVELAARYVEEVEARRPRRQ